MLTITPIQRSWEGEAVVCMASGPYLTREDCIHLRKVQQAGGVKVIGCNDTYQWFPTLDSLYAADGKWWLPKAQWIKTFTPIPELLSPAKNIVEEVNKLPGTRMYYVRGGQETGSQGVELSENPNDITYNGNSGFQIFNIAFLRGAKIIYLLGFDYAIRPYSKDQNLDRKVHFFGSHVEGSCHDPDPDSLTKWASYYEASLPVLERHSVTVINCSMESAITCFPKKSIQDDF